LEHDIELLLQIWKELRTHILSGDRTEAAEDFIHVLMEHGVDPNNVMAFAVDQDLKSILRDHADEEHFDDELDHDEDEENIGWGN
jgi:heat shock protein HspQ